MMGWHDDRERGGRGWRPFLLVIYLLHGLWFGWFVLGLFVSLFRDALIKGFLGLHTIYWFVLDIMLDVGVAMMGGFLILTVACVCTWIYRVVLRFPRYAKQKLHKDRLWGEKIPSDIKYVSIYTILLFVLVAGGGISYTGQVIQVCKDTWSGAGPLVAVFAVPMVIIMAVIACIACGIFIGILWGIWFLSGRMLGYMKDTLYGVPDGREGGRYDDNYR